MGKCGVKKFSSRLSLPATRDQAGRFRGSGSCWFEAKKEFIIGMCSLCRNYPRWLLALLYLAGLLGSRDTRARLCENTVRLEMWFNDGVKCNILGLGVAGRLLICLNVCCHHEELPRAAHCHHHNLSWPLAWLPCHRLQHPINTTVRTLPTWRVRANFTI